MNGPLFLEPLPIPEAGSEELGSKGVAVLAPERANR